MYFCRSSHERQEVGYTKTLLRKQRTSVIFYSMDKNESCLLYTSEVPLGNDKSMFVYNKDGRLCFDTYHPAQRVVKREDYVDSIIKVVNKFNVK